MCVFEDGVYRGGRSYQADKLKAVPLRKCLHFEYVGGEMVFLLTNKQGRKESEQK